MEKLGREPIVFYSSPGSNLGLVKVSSSHRCLIPETSMCSECSSPPGFAGGSAPSGRFSCFLKTSSKLELPKDICNLQPHQASLELPLALVVAAELGRKRKIGGFL